MKKLFIVTRISSYVKTKQALLDIGVSGMSSQVVQGRGKKSLPFIVGEEYTDKEAALKESSLLPKQLIEIIVEDNLVDKIVKVIIEANKTGNSGDGKIFVLPVDDVYKIRTRAHEL